MYPNVKRQIPEFIHEYLVYADCFTDIDKQKTCWVLTRNLKFFEFCQKQLMASIDLHATCLSELKSNLENYDGPKGKWHETSNPLTPMENTEQTISLDKYVFHTINIYKIYIIIKCWNKCIVLRRLPDFKGFQVKAEYSNLTGYRIIHGAVKYCPVLELKFHDNEIIKTDFEEKLNAISDKELFNKKNEMRQLLEQIRCAKTELQLHKSITSRCFNAVQNNLTMGVPFLRSFKLEEKQILGRCGDIWKRFTAYDDLVIGVPLVNQCALPNLCIIRNIIPVLQTNMSEEHFLQLHYRLFQLKLKFDQLDELETFIESEDESLQEKIWCANGDLQILPESFMVLLIKIKIGQIISLKESPLILNYEVVRHVHTTSDTTDTTFTIPLQLFLQNIDFHKILFEERPYSKLQFLPHTFHQDFLTIAMTTIETNIKIVFNTSADLDVFENFLQKSLNFSKPKLAAGSCKSKLLFYNDVPSSLWFGSLILRMKEVTEDDNSQCLTDWKFYCQNIDKTMYLFKIFSNDHLTLQCNISSISTSDDQTDFQRVIKFENALRQELQQLQEIVRSSSNNNHSKDHLKNMEILCQLQMNSDIIASNVMKN